MSEGSGWTVAAPGGETGRRAGGPVTPLDYARWYVRQGVSVLPVRADGSKAPALKAGSIEQYRERFATDDELADWFAPNKAVGIGLVCGKLSGNLAVLDFETAAVWEQWLARVTAAGGHLKAAVSLSPIVKTPNGGRHLYCRISETWVAGQVFAKRASKGVLIESRGQGHYVVCPGSPPACHPTNVRYEFESKGWLENG